MRKCQLNGREERGSSGGDATIFYDSALINGRLRDFWHSLAINFGPGMRELWLPHTRLLQLPQLPAPPVGFNELCGVCNVGGRGLLIIVMQMMMNM